MLRLVLALTLFYSIAQAAIVPDVRAAIGKNDFAAAERLVAQYRAEKGVTPELIEAQSWMGRGALAAKDLDRAESYAAETRRLALDVLKGRKLDENSSLATALGASIEVQSQVMAERGERDTALEFLKAELARWEETSIATRIQKNLNLLDLVGKPAPRIGGVNTDGRPALVFLWAHWCPDCKGMAPELARIEADFGPRGLAIVAPTRRYGYTRRGEDASPAEEAAYIAEVRKSAYGTVKNMPAPIDEGAFRAFGASTVPTIVLVDAAGIVRFYHPGEMTYDELAPRIEALLKPLGRAAAAR